MLAIRAKLIKLMPFKWVLILLSAVALLAVVILLLTRQPDADKWLLPLTILFAWCSSLALTLTGYGYLDFDEMPTRLLHKIKWWLTRGVIRLLEALFVLNCAVLCWLTVRMFGML